MNNSLTLHILNPLRNPFHNARSNFLIKSRIFPDLAKKMPICTKFHEEIYVLEILEDSVEFDYILVLQVGLDGYLSGDLVLVLLLFYFLFRHYFHGADEPCFLVSGEICSTKITGSKFLPNLKIILLMQSKRISLIFIRYHQFAFLKCFKLPG